MPSSSAIPSTLPQASPALLRERLCQLEAALLEARGRVLFSFDRELTSLRGWMDLLENFDPTVGLHAMPEPIPASKGGPAHELVAEPPHAAASNILPFSAADFTELAGVIEEPPVDPCLASATLDELNAALTAAFQQVAEK
jgi:hypothetical protein